MLKKKKEKRTTKKQQHEGVCLEDGERDKDQLGWLGLGPGWVDCSFEEETERKG